jgi:hypothetical protein
MHDAADDPAIIRPLHTPYIRRQMRFYPLPLLIAEPKQVPAHGPNLPNTNHAVWNQNCLGVAAKLMSSGSNFFGSLNLHTLINVLNDSGYPKSLGSRLEAILLSYTGERSSRNPTRDLPLGLIRELLSRAG